ncbi:MAG: hypothetical protein ACFFG0_33935 [Candidatus Thorarchaeota archaeon]
MKVKKKNKRIDGNYNSILKNNSYFDISPISKGVILLGIILLLIYCIYFIVISSSPPENIHEDQIRGEGSFDWIVPISLFLIIIGAIFLFIGHQFVKLSEFAQDVESGEFEKKVLKELGNK